VLPLGNGLTQLVWSAPASRCRQLESLPPTAFLDSLMAVLPDPLEADALRDRPRGFPVGLRLARRLSSGKTVLVGESAHRCHPVGGQGLNLCWRDVAVLHRLASRAATGSMAPHRIAAAYGRRRWPDLVLVLVATDLLVRLHSNRHPLLLPLRRSALALLAAARVAASPEARGLGTLAVLNYDIHAARFVQKSHTALPSAFQSPLVLA
jgi:2-octaprenyl-6-methoxyphenol hydroxylase